MFKSLLNAFSGNESGKDEYESKREFISYNINREIFNITDSLDKPLVSLTYIREDEATSMQFVSTK
jgi:hypothetical protein